jgi:hypothetical protein
MFTPDAVAVVTVRVALPLTPPSAAVIVVDPEATPVANPELSTVAIEVFAAVQSALELMFAVELSL